MLTRDQARRLIDVLPDQDYAKAVEAFESMIDPLSRALLLAPIDDEPETEEERAAVALAKDQIARGEFFTHEEVLRRNGLA